MRKIAIITLNGYYNYGNRLQNYALQEVLKGLGFEVETIINNTTFRNNNSGNVIRRLKTKSIKDIVKYLSKRSRLFENSRHKKINQKREEIFRQFTKRYINETNYAISEDNVPHDLHEKYDFFVVGSDQVWNPLFRKGSSIELLTFVPKEKRIAYAPSFGISAMPKEYEESYRKALTEMPHISVREHAGANIVYDLTGKKVPVVLDPTMMIEKNQWLKILDKKGKSSKGKYLLTYFLGAISDQRKNQIKNIANQEGLKIINLAVIEEEETYLAGPDKFLEYIKSASFFCTDSYHGAVFSILFETPFIIYERAGNAPTMNSRIYTLLETFKLISRHEKNINFNSDIAKVDFSNINAILENERNKSRQYLIKALNL